MRLARWGRVLHTNRLGLWAPLLAVFLLMGCWEANSVVVVGINATQEVVSVRTWQSEGDRWDFIGSKDLDAAEQRTVVFFMAPEDDSLRQYYVEVMNLGGEIVCSWAAGRQRILGQLEGLLLVDSKCPREADPRA